ncbi:MAG TPA: AbrB/MazE/SpoVT family DNA-binding domain-containing protein [Allosphingosinicella sp.]|jgi:antitoxin VapB
MGVHETKTFKSGNSVALRLPKALAIGPDERMVIEQKGDVFTIRRLKDPAEEKRKLLELVEALRALPRPDEVEKREPIEFPHRPGL